MKVSALMIDTSDNVVTCVEEVEAGGEVSYRNGDEIVTLTAEEKIPLYHKIAIKDLAEGENVVKYGENIGVTTKAVPKGYWVSHENVVSVPRDYDSEFIAIE